MHQWTVLMMTVIISAMSLESVGSKEGRAEIVSAHCTLSWEKSQKTETGDCQFRQAFGNVQIWMGKRWAFDFPASEREKSYQRENRTTQIIFKRTGDYTLIINQSKRQADHSTTQIER